MCQTKSTKTNFEVRIFYTFQDSLWCMRVSTQGKIPDYQWKHGKLKLRRAWLFDLEGRTDHSESV